MPTAASCRCTPATTGHLTNSLPTSPRPPLPRTDPATPPALPLTAAERRVVARLRTPAAVQAWLNAPAVQHRDGGRDAAQLPRRRAHGHGALPGGGAVGGDDPRAAPVSAARPQLRVDRSARPRDLRLPEARPDGDRWRARAIPVCTGGKPVFATPRALALSYFEAYIDFTGRRQGVRRRRSARAGRLRLAAVAEERLEGGAAAARLAAPPDRLVGCATTDAHAAALPPRSAKRTATSRGSTTRAASGGRRCRRSSQAG